VNGRRFVVGATAVAVLCGGGVLAACSPTTYDASLASTTSVAATTTTLPTGTAQVLLPRMLAVVQGLSAKVISGDGDQQAASEVEQYWAAVKDEIGRSHPALVADFEFVVRRCRSAADRNRPADADRAYKNLVELVTAVVG
jgi:hypothetical protein